MEDSSMVVWWTTRTECVSAFIRQTREGGLDTAAEKQARLVLETIVRACVEIQPTVNLRSTAERLLAVHRLRAADAFQLAAALQLCRGQSLGMSLVSLDDRLRVAAQREGFDLLPE
jgi:predicted nucleic acid-binding protein